MIYHSEQRSSCYFPPLLGNGDLTFSIDCEGAVNARADAFGNIAGYHQVIYRAGRRLGIHHDSEPGAILSFGKIWFGSDSSVVSFEQELIEKDGLIKSVCEYANGMRILTEAFIHPDFPLYCVRKTLLSSPQSMKVEWRYQLCGYNERTQQAIERVTTSVKPDGGTASFRMVGQDVYSGQICVQMDRPMEAQWNGDVLHLPFVMQEGESVTMFLYLADDLDGVDPYEANWVIANKISKIGYEGLLQENVRSWNSYFDRGYVRTSDEKLNGIYSMALYHLRCYTTKWSIPVGINTRCWSGRFFAFDEYYSFLGLVGANQKELAKRVPSFRADVCLPKAIRRQTFSGEKQARFTWETSEYGEEIAPSGFWYDHVFHMAVIALGAFEYYEYSKDMEFLKHCYRMIRACAKFYTLHMIYRDGDRAYIGKCTDLERLGPSVENAFMTACGVIRTLEVAAEAARILDVDAKYRRECLDLAKRLRQSLPIENDMYVPYLGCPQKSIGVFAGKYPFNVLKETDTCMITAWNDFLENGAAYGNMYASGSCISSWYAGWQAAAFARSHLGDKAYECLTKVYESMGVFNEMFEINEPAKRITPWFTTASGVFLGAVNDMLVESDGETVNILPACPLKDVSFKLAVKGGIVLEAEIKNGELIKAQIIEGSAKNMKLLYKGELIKNLTTLGGDKHD